jgi:hypothetical protein
MKILISENLKLREVQALETLLCLSYNGEKKKCWEYFTPNWEDFLGCLDAPNGLWTLLFNADLQQINKENLVGKDAKTPKLVKHFVSNNNNFFV